MRINIILVALLMAACCFSISNTVVHAAQIKKHKETKSRTRQENPFDLSVNIFNKNDTNNIKIVYRALFSKKNELKKSEYESSKEYNSRQNSFCNKALTGNLMLCDTVAFFTQKDIQYDYDADKKVLTVTLPLAGESIDISSAKVATKRYIGSNAFGVKANVTSDELLSFAISMRRDAPPNLDENGIPKLKPALYYDEIYRQPRYLYFKLSMSPSEAMEMNLHGGIVVIGKLYSPYIDNYELHSKPTIDKPKEIINRYNYVVINPSEIWIVNEKSGKIYIKESVELQVNDYERNIFVTWTK